MSTSKSSFWKRIYVAAVVITTVVIGTIGAVPLSTASASSVNEQTISQDVKILLSDYSMYLSNGQIFRPAYYTVEMEKLIQERRAYYDEFFNVGLHINLLQIKSEFLVDEKTTEKRDGDTIHVHITEKVTLLGTPKISSSKEYPLIQAAYWAISETDDTRVKNALENFIENMSEGVNESIRDGVEIAFIVHHDIVIKAGDKGQFQFISDSFTDKSNDNIEGNDNVAWSDNEFTRSKPDLTRMPDYIIYNTTIEEIGKWLLDDYSRSYREDREYLATETYNRQNARSYINTYTSNPNGKYCPNTSVPQDKTKYNPYYIAQEPCVDCVNYVSQAIKAGGYQTDNTWKPYTYAWINTYGLRDYLLYTKEVGVWYSNLTSLQVGDIAFTGNYSHVVMVGAVSPHRYSGHTSDRKIYSWNSSLTRYMHILEIPGG
ncbi:amidase domain-containing protein [Anaerolinea thermophila]|nr:amidase domain-containing protein [Anaerolinea thermophila]